MGLFTPAKPVAVQSLQTETNDTLQDLELDHSDLNLTDDLLASPEKSHGDIDSVEKVESKADEEADLETPSKEEVSFENIPVIERSESPDPIIAQQEITPDESAVQPEPKIEHAENQKDSPVESTPEP